MEERRPERKSADAHLSEGPGAFWLRRLWDCWKSPDSKGRDHYSYTIITTTPNDLVGKIHDRMPVILGRDDEQRWLDSNLKNTQEVLSLLRPYPAEKTDCYEVTPKVNSPVFGGPECVRPVAARSPNQLLLL